MSSRKIASPQPYGKQMSTPLIAPQTDSAVNYAQLPENILWMTGERGFTKRPGSLPFCKSEAVPQSFGTGQPVHNWPLALLSVRTPASLYYQQVFEQSGYGTDSTKQTYKDAQTLIGVHWNGLVALKRHKAALLRETTELMRAPYSRTDAGYYFYESNGTQLASVSAASLVGDMMAALTPSSTFNTNSQQSVLALQTAPEPVLDAPFPTGNTSKPLSVSIQAVIPQSNHPDSNYYSRQAANTERIDAFNIGPDVFIAGGGAAMLHYDGYRSYLAGCYDMGAPVLNGSAQWNNTLVAGALTGAYRYMFTHVAYLPSGEIIEGNPTVSPVISPAAQNVEVKLYDSVLTLSFSQYGTYRFDSYTTTGTGIGQSVFTIVEPHTFQVGEFACIVQSGVTNYVQIKLVSGQTVTIEGTITLAAATAYISTGGIFRLYRTKAGGDTFYRLRDYARSEAPASALVAWSTDSTADSALTVQYADTATTREAAPNSVLAATEHQERVVLVTNNSLQPYQNGNVSTYNLGLFFGTPTVYYSSGTSKFYFPSSNTFNLPPHARKAKGLISVNDRLFIFSENSIQVVEGVLDNASTFTVSDLTTGIGCLDSRSLISIDGTIFFRSQLGLAMLRGNAFDYEWSQPISDILADPKVRTSCYHWRSRNLLLVSVLKPLISHNWSNSSFSATAYDHIRDTADGQRSMTGGNYRLAYMAGNEPAYTLVYDFESKRWSKWTIDTYNGAVESFGDLIVAPPLSPTGDPTYYTRLSMSCNWTDNGKPFTAKYFTEWYDGGVPAVDKSFNRAQIFSTDTSEAGGQGFKLTVSTERDWQPGLVVDKFEDLTDFKVDTGYAETPYDSQPYGDPELSDKVLPLSNQRCKSLRVVIENSEPNRNIAINGVAVEINPKFVNMKDE